MTLVVDASVGLKWVLQEADSPLAERLARSDVELLVPDFWLHEACNVLWLQVRRKLFTPNEAREALALLRAQVEPTPTAELRLYDVALEIGVTVNHSTYDTLYVAFALAMGAESRRRRWPLRDSDADASRPRSGRDTPAARRMGQRPVGLLLKDMGLLTTP